MTPNATPYLVDCCPLCGEPNRCAMEQQRLSGQPQPPCWCTQVDFSADLLARVPAEAARKACICAACAAASAARDRSSAS